jgi:hypothetical protein
MSDIDDNMLEDFEEEPIAPASKSAAPANRNFFIAIAVIGALFLLSLIGLAVYGAVILPQQSEARRQQAADINAQNTATALALTQIAGQVVIVPSVTPNPTDPVVVQVASATPVLVFATATEVPSQTPEPLTEEMVARTETVAALLTQAAGGTAVVGGPAAEGSGSTTELPTAGFADDIGLPGMLGMSLLLVVMIFLVRRLRFTHR